MDHDPPTGILHYFPSDVPMNFDSLSASEGLEMARSGFVGLLAGPNGAGRLFGLVRLPGLKSRSVFRVMGRIERLGPGRRLSGECTCRARTGCISPRAGVRLHPVVVRIDRRGRFSGQRLCGFHGGEGPGYLAEDDRSLLASLLCASARRWTAEFNSPVPMEASRAPAVIEQAIATGRCHWRTKDEPPLTWGPSRGGRIVWVVDVEGGQVPSLEGEYPVYRFLVAPRVRPPHEQT